LELAGLSFFSCAAAPPKIGVPTSVATSHAPLAIQEHMRSMPVPTFDPRPQNEPLLPEIKAAFARILETGKFIGGEHVEQFERDFAAAVEVPHATAVSSGTDALLVALTALGVGPGDGVVTTPFTFFATAGAI